MNILLDPNLAYLLLLAGTLLGLMALVTPGTGALEVGAFFCLALAGYSVTQLDFNLWALILLMLSVIPFLYAIQKPKRETFLILAIIGMVFGSAYLFKNPNVGDGFLDFLVPAVNPFVALVSSVMYAGLVWIAVRKSMQAFHAPPAHNPDALVGQVGEAKTDIHAEGSAQVGGELWSARSAAPIPAGVKVKVKSRDGFVLEVEAEPDHK